MRNFSFRLLAEINRPVRLGLAVSLLGCGLALAGGAPAKPPEPADLMRASVMSVRAPSRMPSPEAGIKLLEDIIQRVKNVPQLAMAKQGLKYQAEQSAASAQQGPTDYRLAIRPQEQALKPAVNRNSNVIAWGQFPASPSEPVPAQSNTGGGNAASYGDEGAASNTKGFWERDSQRQVKRKEATNSASDLEAGASVADGFTNAQGIWEREKENAQAAVNRLSPESRKRISASAGKLFNLAQGLDAVQQSVNRGSSATRANEETKSKGAMPAKRSQLRADEKVAFYQGRPQLQIVDDRPVIHDFREPASVPAGGGGAAPAVRGGLLARQSAAAPSPPPASNVPVASPAPASSPPAVAGALNTRARGAAGHFAPPQPKTKDTAAKKTDKSERVAAVALLPPNVVTGIPLVHLGYSEAQTTQALGTLGAAARHTGAGWTVLTFRKAHTEEAALQVYMRHGQVEALRIFDPALIGPDFGVTLGSDLSAVKLKFGEPTFILSEPYSGQGQNYVYPISQVAFQLSRPARGRLPQVISLLIFNVK